MKERKTLYITDNYERLNEEGLALDQECYEFFGPLVDKWAAKGYKVRDIEGIVTSAARFQCCSKLLDIGVQNPREKEPVNKYNPDSVSPPGATIKDWMEENNVSVDKLAKALGRSPHRTRILLAGHDILTRYDANQLCVLTGSPSAFWLTREKHYREFLAKEDPK